MKACITEVRKVAWDKRWHVCYDNSKGCHTWSRVKRKTAMKYVKRIGKISKLP